MERHATIAHACGHEAAHALPGSEPEARGRADWLRRQPCPACWRAQQRSGAAAQAGAWGLPPLEGGADAVAWAEVIRAKTIAHNRDYHRLVATSGILDGESGETRAAILDAADAALRALETQADAGWWIAHRFEAHTWVKQRVLAAAQPILAITE